MIYCRVRGLGFKKDTLFESLFRDHPEQNMDNLEKVFRLKQIFFDSLVYLLNNYRPYASLNKDGLLSFNR